jgi:hypothetical protein
MAASGALGRAKMTGLSGLVPDRQNLSIEYHWADDQDDRNADETRGPRHVAALIFIKTARV